VFTASLGIAQNGQGQWRKHDSLVATKPEIRQPRLAILNPADATIRRDFRFQFLWETVLRTDLTADALNC
jgi:hypothetical protein